MHEPTATPEPYHTNQADVDAMNSMNDHRCKNCNALTPGRDYDPDHCYECNGGREQHDIRDRAVFQHAQERNAAAVRAALARNPNATSSDILG